MYDKKHECKNPKELKGKPGECAPEQKKRYHGDKAEHSCDNEGGILGDAKMEKQYWFKPRTWMGFGWIPVTWEGVLMYLFLLAGVIFSAWFFNLINPTVMQGFSFLGTILLLMFLFGILADHKTTKPVMFKKRSADES
ncbi:hypothetical protein ACFL54_05495 [Planctomycetota bacterium]